MKKKDVLFLCQFFYPEYISSATLPLDTALALTESGFSVEALCGYPKEYNVTRKVPKVEIYKDIKIRRLKYIQLKRSSVFGRLINYFSFTFSVLIHFFQLRKYKMIFVYSNPPILPIIPALANTLFRTEFIFVCYDMYPEIAQKTNAISETGIISRVMKGINKRVFSRVRKVVALSTEMKLSLLKNRPVLSEHQIEIIPNWFLDKNIQSINDRFNPIKAEGYFVISYFGNIGTCQDINTIVAAIRELKNEKVKFMFAGHGNKLGDLKKIAFDEKLDNVIICDFLHGEDFESALNLSDCFVVTLASGLIGLCVPSKTYSYMMAGRPIIAIMDGDSDITTELKENDMGYRVDVGDSEQFIRIINELREDDTRRIRMGENSRKHFLNKYTTQKCTEKYVSMLNNIFKEEKIS